MTYQLTAEYKNCSVWELDFDLNAVHDWFIKWDTLHVKFKAADKNYVEIHTDFSGSDDHESYKFPIHTSITQISPKKTKRMKKKI